MITSLDTPTTIGALLAHLRDRDVKISTDAGKLQLRAPKGALTPSITAQLRERKQEIIDFLQQMKGGNKLPPIEPVPRSEDPLPLSYAQQRLWFMDQLHEGAVAYNIPSAYRLLGPLDPAVLVRALEQIVARHEALRTCFPTRDGEPVQAVAERMSVPLPLVDMDRSTDSESAIRALIDEEALTPFDLATGPLFRLKLLRLAECEHVLLLNLHHIIADGWSVGILVAELATLYRAYLEGAEPSLSPLPIQYQDFAHWQRSWLSGDTQTEQLAWWKEQLAGAPHLIDLPNDRPRPVSASSAGGRLPFTLDEATGKALVQLGREADATAFMTFYTVFAILLSRYSGQEDLVIGSPIANRNRKETENLIGFFVNPLVLRCNLAGDPSFNELLARTRKTAVGAFSHQDLPFEQIVEHLRPERKEAANPLFQVLFVMANEADTRLEMPDQVWQRLDGAVVATKFDLTLSVTAREAGFSGHFEYLSALFDGSTVGRFRDHFLNLIDEIVADPDRPISRLALEPASVPDWPEWQLPGPDGPTLHGLFEIMAARYPRAKAVCFEGVATSYAALNVQANRIAAKLADSVQRPVAVMSRPGPHQIAAVIGVLKAGGAFVGLDPNWPDHRLEQVLKEVRPAWLLCDRVSREQHAALLATDRETLLLDEPLDDLAESNPHHQVSAHAPCYLVYTSGSTGRPKGIVQTHTGLLQFACWFAGRFGIGPGARVGNWASLSYDAAYYEVFGALCHGATLHIPADRGEPAAVVDWLVRERIQVMKTVPSFARPMLAEIEAGEVALDHLRYFLLAGEALPPAFGRAWLSRFPKGPRLVNLYGPSEAILATIFPVEEACLDRRSVPIGSAIEGRQILILDKNLKPCPVGITGELYIRSPFLTRGYYENPRETERRYLQNPLRDRAGDRVYRTGDLGRWLADGNLEFAGRIDGQVKIRGQRVELGEIESVLGEHPAVAEAGVALRPSVQGELLPAAYVVLKGSATVGALHTWMKQRLPQHMLPESVTLLAEMPHTATGKLDRKSLPDPEKQAVRRPFVAPRDHVEETLASIFAEVLHLDKVGVDDDFFAIGGHSLVATQAVSRIRITLAVEMRLADLFAEPTVARLANLARARLEGERPGLPPIRVAVRKPLAGIDGTPRGARVLDLPLSFSQQRLWFLDQLEGRDTATYNLFLALRLQGDLDVDLLSRVCSEIIRRHEVLRTSFVEVAGHARPVVHEPRPCPIPLTLMVGAEDEHLARLAREEHLRPFDLTKGPLLRLSLLRLRPQEHVLMITKHHIVTDGWSFGVMVREMVALYRAWSQEKPSPLAEPVLQYADYAVWQRDWMKDQVMKQQRDYWRKQLAGIPDRHNLPTDRPRPALQRSAGASRTFALDRELHHSLTAQGRESGATLFMVLEAAFAVLVSRYSQAGDILIGTPIAGRIRKEIEPLVGLFVNTLVLRNDLSGNPGFADLLLRVKQTALGAYQHADLPFEDVVDVVSPERSLAHTPLFQIMFSMQTATMAPVTLPDLKVTHLELDRASAMFDLTLIIDEGAGGLHATWEYSTDLFDAATMTNYTTHFRNLLTAIIADPNRSVAALPLLDDAERRQLLVEVNSTGAPSPDRRFVVQHFEAQAAQQPQAVALICGEEQLSYARLNERANRVAHHLRDLGARPETVIGILCERGIALIVGFLAALKSGACYLPLDPTLPSDRLRSMLTDAGCDLLFSDRHDRLDTRPVIVEDDAADAPATNPPFQSLAAHAAYLIYTSGSSGRPKGVLVPQASLAAFCVSAASYYGIGRSSRVLQFASVGFDTAVEEIFPCLSSGGTLVLRDEDMIRTSRALLRACAEFGITVLDLPTAYWHQIVHDLAGEEWPSHLKLVIIGGERARPELLRRWREQVSDRVRLINSYGPTETTVVATWGPAAAAGMSAHQVSIGRVMDLAYAFVVDGTGQLTPRGIPGELLIGGSGVSRGYLGQPALTAAAFVPDAYSGLSGARLYRSGDLVRYLDDGNLVYLDRIDNQVKLRGYRIELDEIASLLNKHPRIDEAVVLLRADDADRPYLAVYAQPKPESAETLAAELRDYLARHLPAYMVPARYLFLDRLPQTVNRKIDHRALTRLEPERAAATGQYTPPGTDAEVRLAAIWAHQLGLERVGIHDNFFELGGDSILSIRIIARAKAAGLFFTPRQFFELQTVARLAAVAGSETLPLAEQGCVTGELALLPIQQWFFENGATAHYNHAVLLKAARLDLGHLEQVITALFRHHDALRLSFHRDKNGWQATQQPVGATPFQVHDLVEVPLPERAGRVTDIAHRCQTGLDLSNGPLGRVALIRHADEDDSDRLLLVLHHLVIDGVSWRILLEDLETGLDQLERDLPLELPAKTRSYRDWANRLAEHATTLAAQLPYWTAERSGAGLPVDFPTGSNTHADAASLSLSLTGEETEALLQRVPSVYHTRIDDLLLSALVLAMYRQTGARNLTVDLESHGREPIFADMDTTRTLGWFTAMYPVNLTLPEEENPGRVIGSVKEQLRAVPDRGIGYGLLRYLGEPSVRASLKSQPAAQIAYNYLGRVDGVLDLKGAFAPAPESCGPSQDPQTRRGHLIELNAIVAGKCLTMSWTYSTAIFQQATLMALAEGCLTALRELVAHCLQPGAGGYTPSDFPLAVIDQTGLDRLLASAPEGVDLYKLSPMQQGLLFHSLFAPASAVYIEQMSVRLRGPLDPDLFRRAWKRVIARHDILRTAFHWRDLEEPVQLVLPKCDLPWQLLDWRDRDSKDRERQLAELEEADRRKGFRLEEAPLLRGTLVRLGETSWYLLWSFHHLLLDGWSVPLVIEEVFAIYRAARKGIALELPRARPYRDHIAWLDRQSVDAAKAFWSDQLAGFGEPTPIGGNLTRLPDGDFAEHNMALSPELSQALASMARVNHLTLSTLAQGAWSLLLGLYSGQSDALFGITVSGRSADLEDVGSRVGLFINTLPARVELNGESTLIQWLTRLQAQQVSRDAFAYVPLLDIQQWSGLPRGTSLFDSILVFENYPVDLIAGSQGDELAVEGSDGYEYAHYPLTAVFLPGDVLQIRLKYRRPRFDSALIDRMAGRLKHLLEAMAADPEARPAQIQTSRIEVPPAWFDTATDYPRETALHTRFEQQAAANPTASALEYGQQRLNYADLNAWANRLAARLIEHGVAPGQSVAVFTERAPAMIASLLAVLKAGAAYLPLDTTYPGQRLAWMLTDSGTYILLCSDKPGFAAEGFTIVDPLADRTGEPAVNPGLTICADHSAYVIYTSGSTGEPKGVVVPHRAVNRLVLATDYVDLHAGTRIAQLSNASFDAATFEIWGALLNGGCLVGVSSDQVLSPTALAAYLRDKEITILFLTTALFNLFARQAPDGFAGLTTLLFGGEAVNPEAVATILTKGAPIRLLHVYGPTENVTFSTCQQIVQVPHGAATLPIGLPIANSTMYVLDRDLHPIPPDYPGELYLGGDGLATGYRGRPALTAEKFVPNPFAGAGDRLYRTGDRVRSGADGAVEFLGRFDDQVKIRGFRIEPGEVQAALAAHEDVAEAVVLVRQDPEKRLIGYVVAATGGGHADLPAVLRGHLRGKMPEYMIPSALVVLDAMPLTANGKVDRRRLPEPEGTGWEAVFAAPETETEEKVAALFAEVLGAAKVGRDDNFFDLGGHSLTATRLFSRLQTSFAVDLALDALFRAGTVKEIAALVEQRKSEAAPAMPAPGMPVIKRYARKAGRK